MTDCATLLKWISYLLVFAGVCVFLFVGIDDWNNNGSYGGFAASIGVLISSAILYGFSVIVRAAQTYINKCKDEEPAEE